MKAPKLKIWIIGMQMSCMTSALSLWVFLNLEVMKVRAFQVHQHWTKARAGLSIDRLRQQVIKIPDLFCGMCAVPWFTCRNTALTRIIAVTDDAGCFLLHTQTTTVYLERMATKICSVKKVIIGSSQSEIMDSHMRLKWSSYVKNKLTELFSCIQNNSKNRNCRNESQHRPWVGFAKALNFYICFATAAIDL